MHMMLKLLAALVVFTSLASAAEAFDQKTNWYSLNVSSPPNGKPLFLTNTSQGVRLQPYGSGDPSQMWTTVWPDYPNAPAVEGNFDLFTGADATSGSYPIRIVNRASGGCLTAQGTNVVSAPCTKGALNKQLWRPYGGALINSGRYLTAVSGRYDPENLAVNVANSGGPAWIYNYAEHVSAELTCHTNWSWNLCFVQGK